MVDWLQLGLNIFVMGIALLSTVIVVDEYICPLMASLAILFKLSESIAGVTIVAFGNATPDVISCYSTLENDEPKLMFTLLIGGGIIDVSLVIGVIAVTVPFTFEPFALFRDATFLLVTIALILRVFLTNTYTIVNCFQFILIYIIYLCFILVSWCYDFTRGPIDDEPQPLMVNVGPWITKPEKKWKLITEFRILFDEFFNQLIPLPFIGWKHKHILNKMYLLLQLPLSIMFRLAIPDINFAFLNHGWSKPMYMVNCMVSPFVLYFIILYERDKSLLQLKVVCGISIISPIFVYLLTSRRVKPLLHNVILIHEFIIAYTVIFYTIHNFINAAMEVAVVLKLSKTILPITILAFANTVGDIATNVNIAKNGLARMGAAACFAGPLFNVVFSAGFVTLADFLKKSETSMNLADNKHETEMGQIGCVFAILALLSILFIVPMLFFHVRKSFGIYLIGIYVQFLLFIILHEGNWIQIFPFFHSINLNTSKKLTNNTLAEL